MKAQAGTDAKSVALIGENPPRRPFLATFLRWEWMLVGLILLDVFINTRLSPFFLDAKNLSRTSSDFMEIGLMMLPMVFIIITGNIDLSIASNMGMSASFMGLLHNLGVNIWVSALAGLLLGTLGGILNGYLVSRVRLPALVVTLGTYAFYRGIAYGLLGDQAARGYPKAFTYFGQGKVFGTLIPFSVALFIILAIVFGLVLHRTTFGRAWRAIGFSPEGARYASIPVKRRLALVYVLAGAIAGLAAIVYTSRLGQAKADAGTGYELFAITAVVLGGASIFGGIGSVHGTLLGVAALAVLSNGLVHARQPREVAGMLTGALLLLSLAVTVLQKKIAERRRRHYSLVSTTPKQIT